MVALLVPTTADMATTTTIDGRTVDFVVRWERGTINRFIYSIAVLDPAADPEVDLERELDMHNSHQSFASRQRLLDHDGDAGNQVIWFTDGNDDGDEYDQTGLVLEDVDEWRANIVRRPQWSVERNRPARAEDSCFDADGQLLAAGDDA